MFMHGRRLSDHLRPSHTYNAGTEHVGFSPTRQTWGLRSGSRGRVGVRVAVVRSWVGWGGVGCGVVWLGVGCDGVG